MESKLRYGSSVFDEEEQGEIYKGVIDYQELADYLNSCGRFSFDYKDFVSKKTELVSGLGGAVGKAKVSVPLIIINEQGERQVPVSGELNKKPGKVAIKQGKLFFSFKLTKDKEIEYTKKIRYEFSNETAIKLTTNNYYDHLALSTYIHTKDNFEVKEYINKKFKQIFAYAENDIGLLKWLYQQAPHFVLQERGDSTLIDDLLKLISYDNDGWLSWFKDASSEILNLLTGFNDITTLYTYLHDHPEKVIEIYSILDSNSQQEFATLLDAISIPLTKNEKRISNAKFTIGRGYLLDSNLYIENNQKAINLQHFELRPTVMDEFLEDIGLEDLQFKVPVNKQTEFHPLDIVTMVDQTTGDEKIVTAIHVKTLSDKKEWDEVISRIVVVASVVAILVSAGTLAAGTTGIVAFIAVAEIVVGGLDILKEILKGSGKEYSGSIKWFIDNWDAIAGTYGLVSLSSALRIGIIKHGPKVLARIKNLPNNRRFVSLRNFINESVTSIRVEFYFASRLGLTYCTVLPFEAIVKLLGLGGDVIAKKMSKYGLDILEPVKGNKDIKGLMYFGTKIEEGEIDKIKDILKNVFLHGAKNEDILKSLNNLVEIAKKTNLRRAAYSDFITQISRSNLEELTDHIFKGHLRFTRTGRGGNRVRLPSAKGIHSEDVLDGIKNRIKPGSRRPPNPLENEAYKAHVQMSDANGNWINKISPSGNIIDTTMFPLNWNKQRILEETAFAFKNKTGNTRSPVHFEGAATNGIKIRFVIVDDIITTVYPVI